MVSLDYLEYFESNFILPKHVKYGHCVGKRRNTSATGRRNSRGHDNRN
jgi:hypothetical protein